MYEALARRPSCTQVTRSAQISVKRPSPPPDEPSTPTRRSSDLPSTTATAPATNGPGPPPPFKSAGVATGPLRSEEHTSELQSHHERVCRLLLETKKGGTC